ncbi:hypothetical protein ACFQ1M_00325 [Sungkyunkwania multivorans]|uniref:Uncharacterized protein n=1 Tax=Sungkyunkwania multivorans TaxID=1173618 RepID=A0ABW3CSG9_9FLAO
MKLVKDPENERRDYIFQKNTKTIFGARFITAALIFLIITVIATGIYFEYF